MPWPLKWLIKIFTRINPNLQNMHSIPRLGADVIDVTGAGGQDISGYGGVGLSSGLAIPGADVKHPILVGNAVRRRRSGGRANPIAIDNYVDADDVKVIAFKFADAKGKRPIIANKYIDVGDEDEDVKVVAFKYGNAKGKRLINSGVRIQPEVIEIDEKSSGLDGDDSVSVLDVYCKICLQAKYAFECINVKECSHVYCASCIGLYVASKIEANEVAIGCPDPECKLGVLEPAMCHHIVARHLFDQWCDRLCEEAIEGSEKFYCPFENCSALVILEKLETGSLITNSVCPHCSRMFCVQCRVPWHEGVTCEVYQKLGVNERGKDDLMLINLAGKQQWQRCPKCGFIVERTEGCNYMRCWCCHTFCYKCAGPVDEKTHSCPKCKVWG